MLMTRSGQPERVETHYLREKVVRIGPARRSKITPILNVTNQQRQRQGERRAERHTRGEAPKC